MIHTYYLGTVETYLLTPPEMHARARGGGAAGCEFFDGSSGLQYSILDGTTLFSDYYNRKVLNLIP
jgi:hypothetical protein